MKALGLMSGTSMDGIDVALIETDGERALRFGATGFRPYTEAERNAIRRALKAAGGLTGPDQRPADLREAESTVTDAHAAAVQAFIAHNRLNSQEIDLVGFHGQTVIHRPDLGFTVQIGDGAKLAGIFGIDVVYDLRRRDMEQGGQGAPLVPVFHQALVAASGLPKPVAVVNIGGVANVTWVGEGDPVAFDTGPGNALIDDLVRRCTGEAFDRDGALAAAGTVHQGALEKLLTHPYFDQPPPKSLDRQAFDDKAVSGLSLEDAVASLATFTGASIAAAARHFPAQPERWIVAGGGAKNPAIRAAMAAKGAAKIVTAESAGWSTDHLEAQAFAYLAVRSLKGLPITFPTTTGVLQPQTGGVLARAPR